MKVQRTIVVTLMSVLALFESRFLELRAQLANKTLHFPTYCIQKLCHVFFREKKCEELLYLCNEKASHIFLAKTICISTLDLY